MGFTELGRRLKVLEQGKLIEIFQTVLNSYKKEIALAISQAPLQYV
jgi:hypothetical protein